MATSDPIADMLTRIRNATRNKTKNVTVNNSKICAGIAQVMLDEGYISEFDIIDDGKQGQIRIGLKYGDRGEDVILNLTRISKPSCRVYRGVEDLPQVLDGLGIAVVSTNKGVMSDRKCRDESVGGELLCTIY